MVKKPYTCDPIAIVLLLICFTQSDPHPSFQKVGEDEVADAAVGEQPPGCLGHCRVDGDPGRWVETAAQGRMDG